MARPDQDLLKDLEDALAPGSILGTRYKIERRIGVGGMGTVYAAQHLALRRRVALKVIARQHCADPRHVARFRREARVASQLRHPNVVEVLDLGQADGREYIAMEFLEGMDLCDAIHLVGCYEPADALPILDQVLKALEAAHGAGLVHRDLKPENVYLAQQANGDLIVKLLDFGVVKVMEEGAQAQLTRTGTVVGTPEYMAPEQATTGKVDHRSDLYAVGCIAHAMVCGRPPFVGKSVLLVMSSHVTQVPPAPSTVRPELLQAPGVDAFVLRALEKDPEKRWQSAKAMRNALAKLGAALGESDLAQRKITLPALGVQASDVQAVIAAQTAAAVATDPPPNSPMVVRKVTVTAPIALPPRSLNYLALILSALVGALLAVAATFFLMRLR